MSEGPGPLAGVCVLLHSSIPHLKARLAIVKGNLRALGATLVDELSTSHEAPSKQLRTVPNTTLRHSSPPPQPPSSKRSPTPPPVRPLGAAATAPPTPAVTAAGTSVVVVVGQPLAYCPDRLAAVLQQVQSELQLPPAPPHTSRTPRQPDSSGDGFHQATHTAASLDPGSNPCPDSISTPDSNHNPSLDPLLLLSPLQGAAPAIDICEEGWLTSVLQHKAAEPTAAHLLLSSQPGRQAGRGDLRCPPGLVPASRRLTYPLPGSGVSSVQGPGVPGSLPADAAAAAWSDSWTSLNAVGGQALGSLPSPSAPFAKYHAWLGYWDPALDSVDYLPEFMLWGRYSIARSTALGNEPTALLLKELMRYEEALNDVNRKTDIHQRGKTAVNYRAIIYARVAAAVRGCSFSLAAEVHTPKDLQRLLPYLGAKFMSGLVHALLHRGTCDQLEAFRSNRPACDASGMERPLSAGARPGITGRRRGKAANSAPGAVWCLALRGFGGSDRLCSIRLSFTRLPGIGPMKAAVWWRLGCHTYDQLEDHLKRVLPPADAVNEDSQLQHGQRTPAGHGAHPADRISAPEPDSSDVAMVGDPPQHHGRPGTCSPSASYDNVQSTQQLNMEGDQASGETRGTQPARRRKHLPSDKHRRTRRRTTSHGSDRDSDARDADAPEPAWDDDASVGLASPTQEALFSVQVRDDLLAPVSELDVKQMREMLGKAIEDVTGQPGWRLEVVGGGRRTGRVHDADWLVTHHTTSTEGVVLPLYRHLVARGLLVPREQGFCRIQSGMGDCLRLAKQSALRGDWQESQQMDRYDHIFGLWITPVDNQGRRRYKRMDIIMVPVNSWPWALMGWTGSRQYLRFLRDTAHHKHLLLNSHMMLRMTPQGMLRVPEEGAPLNGAGQEFRPSGWPERTKRRVTDEADICSLLNIPSFPPAERNCF